MTGLRYSNSGWSADTDSSAPPPFSPADVAGLALWLDASDPSSFTFSSGAVVSQWNDKSGNGRHFTQGTVVNQPSRTGVQNGLSTVIFGGAPVTMTAAVFAPSTVTLSIFGVARRTAAGVPRRAFFSLGSNTSVAPSLSTDTGGTRFGALKGGVAWVDTVQAEEPVNSWVMHTFRHAAGASDIRRNGTFVATTTGGLSPILGAVGSMWLSGDNVAQPAHDIAEILVYDGVNVTGTDLANIETYLRTKWATP